MQTHQPDANKRLGDLFSNLDHDKVSNIDIKINGGKREVKTFQYILNKTKSPKFYSFNAMLGHLERTIKNLELCKK